MRYCYRIGCCYCSPLLVLCAKPNPDSVNDTGIGSFHLPGARPRSTLTQDPYNRLAFSLLGSRRVARLKKRMLHTTPPKKKKERKKNRLRLVAYSLLECGNCRRLEMIWQPVTTAAGQRRGSVGAAAPAIQANGNNARRGNEKKGPCEGQERRTTTTTTTL